MTTITLPTNRPLNWKVFLFLLLLIIPAVYAAIPYSLTQTGTSLPTDQVLPVLGWTLVNALIYGGAALIGLFLAAKIGLGLPFVEGWLTKEPIKNQFQKVVITAVIVGVVAALVIIFLDIAVFGPPMEAEFERFHITLPETIYPPAWQGFLASFYGGIVEEVLMRLFLMTLLAWLGRFIFCDNEGRPTLPVLWIANIIAAILFGLGHLPTALAIGIPLTALFITRTVVLNSIAGIAFGWLYWTRGLESAIIAHFSLDIVLHVILVMVVQSL